MTCYVQSEHTAQHQWDQMEHLRGQKEHEGFVKLVFWVHGVHGNVKWEARVGTTGRTVEERNHKATQCYHSALPLFSLLDV